jgi:hypothetical protein
MKYAIVIPLPAAPTGKATRQGCSWKLNYMHANPVIRGLMPHPKDWPWSSRSFYFEDGKGLLPMDLVID